MEDRHCDVEVMVYQNEEDAVKKAKGIAIEYCKHREDYREEKEGDIFSVFYSCEGDRVSVFQKYIL